MSYMERVERAKTGVANIRDVTAGPMVDMRRKGEGYDVWFHVSSTRDLDNIVGMKLVRVAETDQGWAVHADFGEPVKCGCGKVLIGGTAGDPDNRCGNCFEEVPAA